MGRFINMNYLNFYDSPLGEIIIASDGRFLTGLWFSGQKYEMAGLNDYKVQDLDIFKEVKVWLDEYFSGSFPGFVPSIKSRGTSFQQDVWKELLSIDVGETKTYGDIAKNLAKKRTSGKMSARAVGSAVGKNKISLIIPCHRVVGFDGRITGYAGGVDRKIWLLDHESSMKLSR